MSADHAQLRKLASELNITPKEVAELEAVFGPGIWAEIEEIAAGPSIVEMTEDLATDLTALPEPIAVAIMLRRVGRKALATAVLAQDISIDEALAAVAEALAAARAQGDDVMLHDQPLLFEIQCGPLRRAGQQRRPTR